MASSQPLPPSKEPAEQLITKEFVFDVAEGSSADEPSGDVDEVVDPNS